MCAPFGLSMLFDASGPCCLVCLCCLMCLVSMFGVSVLFDVLGLYCLLCMFVLFDVSCACIVWCVCAV